MIRAHASLALLFGLLFTSSAPAQQQKTGAAASTQMYEDIEIMGRILDHALNLPRYSTVRIAVAPSPLTRRGGFGGGFGGQEALGGGFGGQGGFGGNLGGGGFGGNLGGGFQGGFSGGGSAFSGGGQGSLGGEDPFGYLQSLRTVPMRLPSFPKAQGTYIKGHGVVYTVVLPPPPPETKPAAPPRKEVSEWDQIRGQIRGTASGSSEYPSSTTSKKRSLEDTVLEVLAKNGHHFSQLSDQESLTVSIIFRAEKHGALDGDPMAKYQDLLPSPVYKIHQVHPVADMVTPIPNDVDQQPPNPSGGTAGEKKESGAASGGGAAADQGSSKDSGQGSSDYELLGDLHVKQGQGLEALRAYQQALAKSSDAHQAAAMYLKMAQLYLTVQKDEAQAQQAMESARQLLAKEPAAEKPSPKQNPTPSPLPSRLNITASKRLLDQVGSGKMALESFKNSVTVERLTFGAPQK